MEQFLSIEKQLENIPHNPGVYKYFDKTQKLLYVGKAKDLKKRVSSYWNNANKAVGKLKLLLIKTVKIEVIITNSENDAFLLENNLIKTLKPRYNILLRDDKTYPWLKVTNEEYPRIFKTRNYVNDGSTYFGPYSSLTLMYTLHDILHKIFNIRSCKLPLTEEKIKRNKFNVCLEYHIGNCKAPCVNYQTKINYQFQISLAQKILKGELKPVRNYLLDLMKSSSHLMKFELAQEYKSKLELLENYSSKSIIVNPKLHQIDVFSYQKENNNSFINYLKIMHGSVIQSHNLILQPQLNENDADILIHGIIYIREMFNSDAKEIIVPFLPKTKIENIKFILPQTGDKKKLLDLSFSNINYYIHQYNLNKLKADYGNVNVRLLEQIKNDLHLKQLPVRIECFDNSHHQGEAFVASCVVFVNGKPAKQEYRHFNIKSTDIPDDFAAMEEIIFRRYKHLLEENKALPHLIVVDGGKGQLSSALNSLRKLNMEDKVEIISIAKRLEELFKPNDSLPLYLDKRSETLKLIQRIRNEAHRFAITFHRQKKQTLSLTSQLDDIEGIGVKTKELLLINFKSLDVVALQSLVDLESLLGKKKASIIWKHFHGNSLFDN